MPLSMARRSGWGKTLPDEDGIKAFEIGEDDELLQRGIVTNISPPHR